MERDVYDVVVVAAHGLLASAAAVGAAIAIVTVYIADVVVVVVGAVAVAKVVPPNPRACRIRPSSHLSCDCTHN